MHVEWQQPIVCYFVTMLFVLGDFWTTNEERKLCDFGLLFTHGWRHEMTTEKSGNPDKTSPHCCCTTSKHYLQQNKSQKASDNTQSALTYKNYDVLTIVVWDRVEAGRRKNYACIGGHSVTLNRFTVPSHNFSSHIPRPRSKSDSNNLAASMLQLSSSESDSSSPRNFPPVGLWCRLRRPVSVGGCSVRTSRRRRMVAARSLAAW